MRHSLDELYLQEQIVRSVELLEGRHIEWLLLHNPEVQLQYLQRSHFESLLEAAFGLFESFRNQGIISNYGVATSRGFRVPSEHPIHLSLDRLLAIAEGLTASHGFGAVQAPLSIDAPEAATLFRRAKTKGLVTMWTSPITPFWGYDRPVHPTVALAAMNWALSVPEADWIVCGTLDMAHLRANLAATADVAASRPSSCQQVCERQTKREL